MDTCDNLLNSNILFISESINRFAYSKPLPADEITSPEFINCKNFLNSILNSCYKCDSNGDDCRLAKIKLHIFSYLFAVHFGLESYVPCRPLGFELILSLIIDNQPVDVKSLLDALNTQCGINAIDLSKNIHSSLQRRVEKQIKPRKCILLMIDMYLENGASEFQIEKYLPTVDFRCGNDDPNYILNKIISKLNEKVDEFTSDFESNAPNSILDPKINDYLRLFTLLNQSRTKLNDLNQVFKLWAFFYSLSKLCQLPKYIADFVIGIEKCSKMEVDDHFIIRNRLPGFQFLLKRILIENHDFDQNTLLTLSDSKHELVKDYNSVFAVLVKLSKLEESELKNSLRCLYWNLFGSLDFKQRVEVIHLIQANGKIKREAEDGSISCLLDKSQFNQDLILLINKLSFTNIESREILDLLARLACVSPETLFYRLMLNFLNNKAQIQSLVQILAKFTIIWNEKRLMVNLVKKVFFYIVKGKNERMFQNLLLFLKSILKPDIQRSKQKDELNYFSINALEIYETVLVNSFFNSKVIKINILSYTLELFELITDFDLPGVTSVAYVVELVTVLESKSTREKSQTTLVKECIDLQEKCLMLIEKLVSRLNSKKKQLDQKDLDWLHEYCKNIHWSYSVIISDLTQKIYVPNGLECFFKHLSEVETFKSQVPECVSVIELCVLKQLEIGILKDVLRTFKYEQILKAVINIVLTRRTSLEIFNLLETILKLDLDQIVHEVENLDTESHKWAKLLHLFSDVILIINYKPLVVKPIAIHLINFIKQKCSSMAERSAVGPIDDLVTLYFGKIKSNLKQNTTENISQFLTEVLSRTNQSINQ